MVDFCSELLGRAVNAPVPRWQLIGIPIRLITPRRRLPLCVCCICLSLCLDQFIEIAHVRLLCFRVELRPM